MRQKTAPVVKIKNPAMIHHQFAVAAGELALADMHRVFHADADMAAEQPGLHQHRERHAADAEAGPFYAGRQA